MVTQPPSWAAYFRLRAGNFVTLLAVRRRTVYASVAVVAARPHPGAVLRRDRHVYPHHFGAAPMAQVFGRTRHLILRSEGVSRRGVR
jgi:hypothetical protein